MTKDKTETLEIKTAKRLVMSFKDLVLIDYRYDEKPYFDFQQSCAIIVANETIKELRYLSEINNAQQAVINQLRFWKRVKTEIKNLNPPSK